MRAPRRGDKRRASDYLAGMKRSAGLSRLRALSHIGLAPEAFIPAALEAMHGIVPSSRNLFDWTDRAGRLVRYYFEGPIDQEIGARYFTEFHNRREAEAMTPFRDAVMGRAVVHGAAEVEHPAFFRSALYNEIWRPQGLQSRLEAIVRDRRGFPLGSLVLYRGPREVRFTRDDETFLGRVVPYFAHGLVSPVDADAGTEYASRRDRRAVLGLGPDGELQHLSPDALKMLLLAHGGVTPEAVSRQPRREDFPALTTLWEEVRRPDERAVGAMLTVCSAWGRFVFEGLALRPLASGAGRVTHVSIVQQEPRGIAMRRALHALALTPAQEEVCLLSREGRSQDEIARRLGVARSTVADHVKKIHIRLDVHSARELDDVVERLLEARAA